MPMLRTSPMFLCVLLLAVLPRAVRAAAPVVDRTAELEALAGAASVRELLPAQGTRCAVDEDAWEIDCTAVRRENSCSVRHRRVVTGPCTYEGDLDDLREVPRLDGVPMTLDAIRSWVPTDDPDGATTQPEPGWDRGARIVVPTGRHTLERHEGVAVYAHGEYRHDRVSADDVRHAIFHAGHGTRVWGLRLAPQRGVTTRLTVRELEGVRYVGSAPRDGVAWERTGGVRTVVLDGTGAPSVVVLAWKKGADPVHLGGPQISVGVVTSSAEGAGFRGRAEIEGSVLSENVLPGVSYDFGSGSRILTPRVEFATTATVRRGNTLTLVPYGPSWSLGVGAPVALDGSGDVGVRALAGVHRMLLGLVVSVDAWPGTERPTQTSLLVRASL